MQLKEFNILLDIKKYNKIDYIEVVQGDSFSNVLNISLIDGINPYDLTNTSVEIVFSKPDGTTVQQTDIAVINSAQGKIQCILKTNTIAVPGKVVAEVRVLEGETLLTSTRFEFYVRKSLIDDETVESSNEFGTLQEVILDYNDAIERVNQIEKQVPEQVVTDLNEVSTRVGPLSSLITRIKTSIVNALNGLQTDFNEHQADMVSQLGLKANKQQANWIAGTLQNGWTGTLEYRKNDLNQISVSIGATSGTISGLTIIGNLPAGHRPKRNTALQLINTNGQTGKFVVYINPNGNLYLASDSNFVTGTAYQGQIQFEVEGV